MRQDALLLGCGHGRDERAQAHVDQVDVRDRQGDVARDHDAAAEQAVDEVDQRHVALGADRAWAHASADSVRGTKL